MGVAMDTKSKLKPKPTANSKVKTPPKKVIRKKKTPYAKKRVPNFKSLDGESGVRVPNFKILANDKEITEQIREQIVEISLSDEASGDADELTITLAGEFKRPKADDTLKIYFGYGEDFTFMGKYTISGSERIDNNILTIEASSINYNGKAKERRDKRYSRLSVKHICQQIANRHKWKLKCDYEKEFLHSVIQRHESDIHFLNRLAKKHHAIFNIKNDTLIFLHKEKNEKKNTKKATPARKKATTKVK